MVGPYCALVPSVLSTALGLRPRAVLKTSGTVFLNTDRPRPANNIYIPNHWIVSFARCDWILKVGIVSFARCDWILKVGIVSFARCDWILKVGIVSFARCDWILKVGIVSFARCDWILKVGMVSAILLSIKWKAGNPYNRNLSSHYTDYKALKENL